MRVLSLFDGVSCGQVALERAGFTPSIYMASEIDRDAIKITQSNYSKTVQLGDVRGISAMINAGLIGNIDLLMGGSPCQGFSRAGYNLGFDDPRSKLFFEFAQIRWKLKPKYFLLENVKMKQKDQDIISLLLGVQPVEIDSALFSAQRRKRLYWTNIPIAPIVDRNIMLWNILQHGDDVHLYKCEITPSRIRMWANGKGKSNGGECPNMSFSPKSNTVTGDQDRSPNAGLIQFENFCRYLTPVECERLQTLPDDYTIAAKTRKKRWRAIGNGWTVDVIAHILRGMK